MVNSREGLSIIPAALRMDGWMTRGMIGRENKKSLRYSQTYLLRIFNFFCRMVQCFRNSVYLLNGVLQMCCLMNTCKPTRLITSTTISCQDDKYMPFKYNNCRPGIRIQ